MKFFLLFLVSGTFLSLTVSAQIDFITYNIRYNNPDDGENAWPNRKEKVAALFKFHGADIFCVQEALDEQVKYMEEASPGFAREGVGRDDGKEKGEYSAVFYKKSLFTKMDGGTFWLSETPEQCSYGWDAACRRICTWVSLEEVATGEKFFVFNTHFDHKGNEAKAQSAKLIIEKIKDIAGDYPVILCGDFNLTPESKPIQFIRHTLNDAFEISILPPYGSVPTYHGFTYDSEPGNRIDYVFVSDGVNVLRYGALTDATDRQFYSDHLPVLVTIVFEPDSGK